MHFKRQVLPLVASLVGLAIAAPHGYILRRDNAASSTSFTELVARTESATTSTTTLPVPSTTTTTSTTSSTTSATTTTPLGLGAVVLQTPVVVPMVGLDASKAAVTKDKKHRIRHKVHHIANKAAKCAAKASNNQLDSNARQTLQQEMAALNVEAKTIMGQLDAKLTQTLAAKTDALRKGDQKAVTAADIRLQKIETQKVAVETAFLAVFAAEAKVDADAKLENALRQKNLDAQAAARREAEKARQKCKDASTRAKDAATKVKAHSQVTTQGVTPQIAVQKAPDAHVGGPAGTAPTQPFKLPRLS